MPLAELRIQNLRCVESAQLNFSPELNLIAGANGAGKTSILEAIFLLGRGRSFRTRSSERLIRHGQPTLKTCSIPLRNRRLSPAGRDQRPRSDGSSGPISSHSASDKSPRPMTAPQRAALNQNLVRLGIPFVNTA